MYAEELFKNTINDLSWNEADGGDIPINLIKEGTFILPYLALRMSWWGNFVERHSFRRDSGESTETVLFRKISKPRN